MKCGDIDLGWIRLGQRQRVAEVPRATLLHVPRSGRLVYQFGARTLEAHPAVAVLLPPGREFRACSDRYDAIGIRVPDDALAVDLAQRRGAGAKPISWDAIAVPVIGEVARRLQQLHQGLV